TSTEMPTLKTGEDGTTMGLMAPQGTLVPFATGGFGGAVDPAADTAVMQEEAETSAPDIFSAVPAPVVTGSEEPPSTMMEEMEAPGDSPQATPTRALATAPATVSAVGRMAASIEPTDAAMAEMSMPPMTALPADEVIETV